MSNTNKSPCEKCKKANTCNTVVYGLAGCTAFQKYFRARWHAMQVEYWKHRALQEEKHL